MLPVEGHAKRSVGALKGPLEARLVVQVGLHDLSTGTRESQRLLRSRVPGDGPNSERSIGICQNGTGEAPTLSACRTHHREDSPVRHVGSSVGKTNYFKLKAL